MIRDAVADILKPPPTTLFGVRWRHARQPGWAARVTLEEGRAWLRVVPPTSVGLVALRDARLGAESFVLEAGRAELPLGLVRTWGAVVWPRIVAEWPGGSAELVPRALGVGEIFQVPPHAGR